jgi:hypothetical protein
MFIIYRRLRCYSYIINLSIKAFLFSDNPNTFKLEIDFFKKLKLEIRYKRELLTL